MCVKRKNITIVLAVKDFKRRNTQQTIYEDDKISVVFWAVELRNQLIIMILLWILLLGRLLCVR